MSTLADPQMLSFPPSVGSPLWLSHSGLLLVLNWLKATIVSLSLTILWFAWDQRAGSSSPCHDGWPAAIQGSYGAGTSKMAGDAGCWLRALLGLLTSGSLLSSIRLPHVVQASECHESTPRTSVLTGESPSVQVSIMPCLSFCDWYRRS